MEPGEPSDVGLDRVCDLHVRHGDLCLMGSSFSRKDHYPYIESFFITFVAGMSYLGSPWDRASRGRGRSASYLRPLRRLVYIRPCRRRLHRRDTKRDAQRHNKLYIADPCISCRVVTRVLSKEKSLRGTKGPAAQRGATRSFWLIFDRRGGPLTLRPAGAGKTLAVFSFVEEADLFLRLVTEEAGLCIGEITREELISLLFEHCPGVEQVALDPPGRNESFVRLVSLDRDEFLRFLSRR